jgi:MFS family permease
MPLYQSPWLRSVSEPGAPVFAILFSLESLTRASLSTVIPLQAYDLLQEARDVSALYFAVGLVGLGGGFAIPLLIHRLRRRWVYSLGGGLLILAAILIGTGALAGQIAGMLLRNFGQAALNIGLSLYVLDYIRRRDLVHSEPLKLLFSAAAWSGGPALGVFLYERVGPWAAVSLSAGSAALLLLYFWYLRIRENPAVAAATPPPPHPLKSVPPVHPPPPHLHGWRNPVGRHTVVSLRASRPPSSIVL